VAQGLEGQAALHQRRIDDGALAGLIAPPQLKK
jgi:hypothetical protein